MLGAVLTALKPRDDIQTFVIGLLDDEAMGQKIRDLGIPVVCLNMHPGIPDPRAMWKLVRTLKAFQPDLIQSWLYHPDLMSTLASPWVGRPPVVWNIRHATLDPLHDSRSTLWISKLCAWLSRRSPARILVNSQSGQKVHADYGYERSKLIVVPNGFDLERYRPSESARTEMRRKLGLPADAEIIGMVARFSSLKGHDLFIRAMELVAAARPQCEFVLCGREVNADTPKLMEWIRASRCPQKFHLLGERKDAEQVHAGLDIEVSASTSEAFSNSIGEALCCGVPCVVTDVGDSAQLVGSAGRVVPSQDTAAMANACLEILDLLPAERECLSHSARDRMVKEFEIGAIANRYSEIWAEVIAERGISSGRPNQAPTIAK